MTDNVPLLLYALLILLGFLLSIEGYNFVRMHMLPPSKRRRLLRIKVPRDKAITCRILEPLKETGTKEFMVDDITLAGISFFADRVIDRQIVKLGIRFPFMTFKDAASVWGKVVYCNRCGEDGDRYRIGIAYLRRTPPTHRNKAGARQNGE
jgi:c-di-GMP-binding flagellar brake protein YcgR